MSIFQIFPISVEGGGHRKSFFSQIQNSPHYPRGGRGHENYGLFPQFGTFSFWHAPLRYPPPISPRGRVLKIHTHPKLTLVLFSYLPSPYLLIPPNPNPPARVLS